MTQDEVRRLFDYDAETGDLTWRVSPSNSVRIGNKAGSDNGRGYLQVMVDRKLYLVHRVIWLLVHGYFPEHEIDHVNRNRADNRLENLREVTKSCNVRNSRQRTDNISGVTGVCWDKISGKWKATIGNNKQYHIGYFTDFTEAVKARHQAEVKYDWPGCNSSTDAYRYLKEADYGQ
jgi:hypothetical protein